MANPTEATEPVILSLDEAVATLTLNRPERLNALDPAVFAAWNKALDDALAAGARALVITGAGRAFCAGADLLAAGGDEFEPDLAVTIERYYNPLARKLASLSIPVLTAVNGPAVGAGMGFALLGDIIIAARSSYFQMAFAKVGLVPDAGTTWLVARSVGRARALEMALLGDAIVAEEALAMGLITRLVEDGEALAQAQEIAARLTKGPTEALGLIRQQVSYALDNPFDLVLEQERDNQQMAGRSPDFAEAVAAFREKRQPEFKGGRSDG